MCSIYAVPVSLILLSLLAFTTFFIPAPSFTMLWWSFCLSKHLISCFQPKTFYSIPLFSTFWVSAILFLLPASTIANSWLTAGCLNLHSFQLCLFCLVAPLITFPICSVTNNSHKLSVIELGQPKRESIVMPLLYIIHEKPSTVA